MRVVLDELEEVVDDPGLSEDIASLLRDLAVKLDLKDEEIPQVRNLEEVKVSLLQRAEKWTQQWMAEGVVKGRRLGMADSLKHLVQRRLGDLPEWAADRIDRADVDTLEQWFDRVLDADVLEDVFQDSAAP